jgi:N-acetylglucosamine kinase-like BadF-type ATPase
MSSRPTNATNPAFTVRGMLPAGSGGPLWGRSPSLQVGYDRSARCFPGVGGMSHRPTIRLMRSPSESSGRDYADSALCSGRRPIRFTRDSPNDQCSHTWQGDCWPAQPFLCFDLTMAYFLGVDAGGTASRAVLVALDGTVIGRAVAGPGNPAAAGHQAARSIGRAIRTALGDHAAGSVRAGVLGVAGVGMLIDPGIAAAFDAEWESIGLACPVSIVGDAIAALATAASGGSGTVLIAGTGAIAARVTDWRITRTADGLGWLLGDEGSGRWLGLQAVRATARCWNAATTIRRSARDDLRLATHNPHTAHDLPTTDCAAATDRRAAADGPTAAERTTGTDGKAATNGPGTTGGSSVIDGLAAEVAAHAGVGSRDELVRWAGRQPPGRFAELAPLVCAAASAGDPMAQRLVADAVARLIATLDELEAITTVDGSEASATAPDRPVVLAGGLLTAETPVRAGVLAALQGRGARVATARDPAAGAAWLAVCRSAGLAGPAASRLHDRMLVRSKETR